MHLDLFNAKTSMAKMVEALLQKNVCQVYIDRIKDVIFAYMVNRGLRQHTMIPVTVTISDVPQPDEMSLVQLTFGPVEFHFLVNGNIHLVVK